jgi:hypothetical protein
MSRFWTTLNLYDVPAKRKGSRRANADKGKAIELDQKAMLEELISEAINELVDDKWCLLYEARLRRQAALLQFANREQDVNLIAAVAAVLHPNSQIPAREQAFPRAMMRFSIEQGPLRLMAESLSTGNIDLIPTHLFNSEE